MTENVALVPEVVGAASETEQQRPQLTLVPTRITEGRDELNLAEWPLSALSDKSDPSIKTIYFEDKIFDRSRNEYIPRRVTITGSDAFGLPTPLDEEVLLALIQLSKAHGFTSKRVYFNRYQLLQILKLPANGQNYKRIEQALNRWMGVTMYYKNAWRDRKTQSWVDESFHMLERVKIVTDERHSASSDTTSYFEWNEAVFKSFQNGNVKALNYDFFLSIESAIAKRLYR
ncbi:MAG: replication initiator protein A, partial [Bdellovibrionales bacterium]|nr:replication initiator protein A [Bdellovibrionales bacterium]